VTQTQVFYFSLNDTTHEDPMNEKDVQGETKRLPVPKTPKQYG
jgi:hypothetical protein